MVQFNLQQKEIEIKIVYYGPAMSGKTTNLQAIHQMVDPQRCGRLMILNTADDRTLFFDLMPVYFKTEMGFSVKVKIFTAPGQIIHNSTRRIILQGSDGIVFVADSQRELTKANNDSWRGMVANLKLNGMDINDIPVVIQFNKRDLPNIRSDAEIEEVARRGKEPVFKAVAIRGEGVLETLEAILRLTWRRLDKIISIGQKLHLDENSFIENLLKHNTKPFTGQVR